ncbi:MAG: hypothetical protein HC849_07400 [Oscillatoriales cyanobacterium RU_3_3]|nr:hypothetical protein [Oscillatoriales cyanobacterium RU_3_3]
MAAGRWEVVGGMWVEPDLNLISGESMVRQVVFGQLYAKEKFGELMRVAWLPDTFGFGWQLPQILRQGGVDRFVTQKLRWNDTTEFPYDAFLWEGLDGSRIFSIMSAPIGEGIESVKVASYVFDWQVKLACKLLFGCRELATTEAALLAICWKLLSVGNCRLFSLSWSLPKLLIICRRSRIGL